MQFGDRRHEAKAETAARGVSGCVAAIEGLEEFRQIVLRNARSTVGNAEHRAGQDRVRRRPRCERLAAYGSARCRDNSRSFGSAIRGRPARAAARRGARRASGPALRRPGEKRRRRPGRFRRGRWLESRPDGRPPRSGRCGGARRTSRALLRLRRRPVDGFFGPRRTDRRRSRRFETSQDVREGFAES